MHSNSVVIVHYWIFDMAGVRLGYLNGLVEKTVLTGVLTGLSSVCSTRITLYYKKYIVFVLTIFIIMFRIIYFPSRKYE